jgi:type I site-specific restriction endonuclease
VDECHRGSAAEDSAWREILEYFSSATQIGLTATPKETKDVSNIDYFGDPIFTYSLKQGIEDGFLAPFKVVRLDIDKDVLGWRPRRGFSSTSTATSSRTASTTSATWTAPWCWIPRTQLVAQKHHGVPQGHRPLCQDHRVLRGH